MSYKIVHDTFSEGCNCLMQSNYKSMSETVFYWFDYDELKSEIEEDKKHGLWFGNDVGVWRVKTKPKKSRCCGRCNGYHDLCVDDMECVEHNITGCEKCFGPRG